MSTQVGLADEIDSSSGKSAAGSVPRIGIIGCGAIATSFHLPALARHPAVLAQAVVVDANAERAKSVCEEYGAQQFATDYRQVLGDLDGVIVTTPHHLHHRISLDCIRSGIHVLCEKPLAETVAEVEELANEADKAEVTLSVNNTRRLYPALQKVVELLRGGAIGRLRRLSIYWGEVFGWPAATGFYFGSSGTPRGVLLDTGAHALDLVCWWLGGKPDLLSYHDDSFGGSEAVARLIFEREGCRGEVQLSWLSKYENAYRLEGESGAIEGGIFDWSSFWLTAETGRRRKVKVPSEVREFGQLGQVLIGNFLAVLGGAATPLVPGREVAASIALIEECYAKRARFDMPWHDTLDRIVRRND